MTSWICIYIYIWKVFSLDLRLALEEVLEEVLQNKFLQKCKQLNRDALGNGFKSEASHVCRYPVGIITH